MKKYLTLVFLFTAFFAFAAEDFADMVDKVESWIEKKYTNKKSKQIQKRKLDKICDNETKDEASKIIELKKTFPEAFQKEEKPLIYVNPLSWKIHSLSLGYDIKESVSSSVKTVDILNSLSQKETESSKTIIITEEKGHGGVNIGAGVQGSAGVNPNAAGIKVNPFDWLKILAYAKIRLSATYFCGRDSVKRSELWSDRNKEIFLKKREQITEMIHQVGVSNFHLTFTVTFTNNTREPMSINVKDAYIPIYIGEKSINNNAMADRNTETVEIKGGQTIDVVFRVNLNTTTARELVVFMGKQTPDININNANIPIVSKNGQNMFVSYERVDTTPVHVSAPEFFSTWNIRKHHTSNSEKVTIREALKAINEDLYRIAQRDLLKWNGGALVSFSDISFEISSDKKEKYRYFVFLQDNDSKKIIPVNAENLDKPLPASGVTLWSIDFAEEKSYENIPSNVKKQILDNLEGNVKKNQQPDLQSLVGVLYMRNFTVKDEKKAVELFRKSAEQGDARGQWLLGLCYRSGTGVEKDGRKAFNLFQKSADQGSSSGQELLSFCYYRGLGVEKNERKAFDLAKASAEQGNAEGQGLLAMYYLMGIGVRKDEIKAFDLAKSSAKQGVAIGQTVLAICYLEGIGTQKDEKKAFELIKLSSEQGDAIGQYLLGGLYLEGRGVPADANKAFDLFKSSAKQDCATGQALLGKCYLEGIVVTKDYKRAIYWLERAVEQGDDLGQIFLGECYLYGDGVEKDERKAFDLFKKASDQDKKKGKYHLGLCYLNGYGIEKDETKAFNLFKESAEYEYNVESQVELGKCYFNALGTKQDIPEAEKWFRKAAEQGHARGQFALATLYSDVASIRNYDEAFKWYRKSAEQGDVDAQIELGKCYYNAIGTKQDIPESEKWFKAAAEQGDARGQFALATLYSDVAVLKNPEAAFKLYHMAAEQGHVKAQVELGKCYYNAIGTKQDILEAVKWFKAAAEQGDVRGQFALATCYSEVAAIRNLEEAVKWLVIAAELGYAEAQFSRGVILYEWEEYEEAVKWFKKAAEQGHVKAQVALASCYYDGKGVSRNPAEAKVWFQKAADQGYEPAKKALQEIGQ